jgi:phospholipid/cholesterol/gamma-HCH transport system permease protein
VNGDPTLEQIVQGNGLALCAAGPWTARFAPLLEQIVADAEKLTGSRPNIFIDVSQVSKLDTFGAWLIERLRRSLTQGGIEAKIAGLSANYSSLVDEVRRVKTAPALDTQSVTITGMLDQVGRSMVGIGATIVGLIDMLGAVLAASGRVMIRPRGFRLTSTVHHLEQVCWRAVPIVVLITFLIGCIISQQGIFHFRKFGADIFVVDMLGVLVLREIGVLLVAIMVAGRSGSAYTAELGSMKMREEIDALSTMGLDPVEVLILPRIIALVLALPILAFIGSMAALYGGGLVAWFYGGMSPAIFLARLHEAVSVTHFEVGIIKAPFMALVIGIVASSEGLRVKGSAESLGKQTTISVVKSIFLVIVLDGAFAVFFASIGM